MEENEFHFRPLSLVCRAKYQGRTYLCPGVLVKSYNFYQISYSKEIWKFITKCDKCYYKVRQCYCDRYYKVRWLLQSATEQTVAYYNYIDHVFHYGSIYLSFASFLVKNLFAITKDMFGHIKPNFVNIHLGQVCFNQCRHWTTPILTWPKQNARK